MASTCVLHTFVVLLTFLVLGSYGFSLKGFCASNCARGKGGNVCKCNGFHFAGKRGSPALNSGVFKDDKSEPDEENYLELDSDGYGIFGYPKDGVRPQTVKHTFTPSNFHHLLQKLLSERSARRGGYLNGGDSEQSWPDHYVNEDE